MNSSSRRYVLITGLPGVGKTTVIQRVAASLAEFHPVGFYTAEIREKGARKGFELIALDGRRSVLSHIDVESPYRVSKYGVDVNAFEAFLDALDLLNPAHGVVIIDEIGRMECLSATFRATIDRLFESDKTIIATIALKGDGLIDEIKHRRGVTLFELTTRNRDTIAGEILAAVRG
jgi:nucleoside-triphosphatase